MAEEQRADSALLAELDGGPRSDWYWPGTSPWRQRWLQSHNGNDGSLKGCQLLSTGICFRPVLREYLEGAVDTLLYHLVLICAGTVGQLQLFSVELDINVAC